ncbi:MAG: DUF3307 domain-containing protein [Prevotella sp.]|nr:DUF3307 domain-containing protein [Prevotella sp.]
MNISLLISLLICHYLADFVLTSPAMIRAKADGRTLLPIFWHAAIHALLMGLCLLFFKVELSWLVVLVSIELLSHFLIDTAKGRLTARFPQLANSQQKPYWMLYGFDQLLHLLIIVTIWFLAGANSGNELALLHFITD